MGAKARNILTVFLFEGLYIGLIGLLTGIAVGVALSQLTRAYGLALDPEIYYIQSLPIAVDPGEVAVVAGAVLLISLLAALFPAVSAMRQAPVQGLRFK
jgi:lipoprotein-releasing system permease protein